MHRTAGRIGDAVCDPAVTSRRDVPSADAYMRRRHERPGQVPQPVPIGPSIAVDVSDDFTGRRLKPCVSGTAQSTILSTDHAESEVRCDCGRPVRRPIVDDDDLVVGIVERPQSFAAISDGAFTVVDADDDRNPWPLLCRGVRSFPERSLYGFQRRLGMPVAASEAEGPVVDIGAAPIPLIGPG